MKIVTYEMLVQEEKNRQVATAILTGVAAAGNAYSASQAGYGHYTTPSGRTGSFKVRRPTRSRRTMWQSRTKR